MRGGVLAGFCSLSFAFSTEAGGTVLLIEEIYVDEAFRGRGLASEMIAFVRAAYDASVKRYRLEVMPENAAAIRLYERLGFAALPYVQMVLDL